MKIIHCADIHIGSSMRSLLGEKAKQRRGEILNTFKRLASYATENGVTAILIAGDFFDTGKIAASILEEVSAIIAENREVLFFYVRGNHDENPVFSPQNTPQNLIVVQETDTWTQISLLENITLSGICLQDSSQKLRYESLSLNPSDYNIAVLHGETAVHAENSKEFIPLKLLANRNIDYLALGHIHKGDQKPKKLDTRGVYCYSGCLEGRGFDECDDKGFFLLDIQNKKLRSIEFIPFAERKILSIEVDITNCHNYFEIEKQTENALLAYSGKEIIEIILTGSFKPATIKELDRLSSKLNQKFFFCRVIDKSKMEIQPSDYAHDVSLKGEFIRTTMAENISEELKLAIIDMGLKALSAEEIDI